MKRSFLNIIASVAVLSSIHGQARITPELQQRLQGKTDFYEIHDEVHEYFRQHFARFTPADSLQRRLLNRQMKFWNRWLYDTERHLDDNGSISNYSRNIYEAVKKLPKEENADRAANSSWTMIGPTTVDEEDGIGRVSRMGFHPTNSQIIYAGTAHGGLWKSTNGGSTWSAISAFLPSLGISGIEVKADDPNTIYVLTGEGDAALSGNGFSFNFGYVSLSNGVFKTTDGGTNWTQTAAFPGSAGKQYTGFQLRQDPNNVNGYVAATSIGIFRTSNGGASWSLSVFQDLNGDLISTADNDFVCFDLEFKPGSSTVLYAGVQIVDDPDNDRFAFFRSTTSGAIFEEVNLDSDIEVDSLIRFEIGVTPAEPNSVFLACGPGYLEEGSGSSDTFLGFLKSTNSGVSFDLQTNNPDIWGYNPAFGPTLDHQCFYDMALAISPTDPDYIFTGGLVVYRSTDGGFDFDGNTTYWTAEVGESIHPDIHDLKYNPLDGKLYAATDGGVFVTANNGGAWDPLFNGLAITQFYHIEPDNENNKLWGGTQDNGVLEHVSGGEFAEFFGGDGFDLMTDNEAGNGNDSYWTTNGGAHTTGNFGTIDITPPAPNGESRVFGTLEMNPFDEDVIYIGYSDAVWYSAERGDSWETDGQFNRLAGGMPKGSWCIEKPQDIPGQLYAAGAGTFFRIDDIDVEEAATGNATNLAPGLIAIGFPTSGAGLRRITDIYTSDVNGQLVWITVGGFSDGKKVYESDNSGSNWENISYDLPNVPVNCIVRDGTILYVGTDIGVFYLPPFEEHWLPWSNGLPRVPVTEMHIVTEFTPPSTFTDYLYAGTYGRGIWKSQLFTDCASDVTVGGVLVGDRFYQADNEITSTAIIQGGAGTNVYFQSGNEITLTTGFEGKTNSVFTGYIQPCNTGPLPGINENLPLDRTMLRNNAKHTVIESMITRDGYFSVRVNVRVASMFSVDLWSVDGTLIKELESMKEYPPGRHEFKFPLDKISGKDQKIALTGENGIMHLQSYFIK